ncbi:Ssl1-like-domain-containing protein [Obelidium mucronatum]|nr:Ssl1-like-domain-containing protein [Obelidium mucronatum]
MQQQNEQARNGTYHWENAYKRSWDALEEDESGSLAGAVASIARDKLQRRRTALSQGSVPVHRGLIRHQYLVIDMSEAMAQPADHLPPTRVECVLGAAAAYVAQFLAVNALSSVGLVATRDGGAERLLELSGGGGGGGEHGAVLGARANREPRGEASLQNALAAARASLLHVAAHGSREVLVLLAALATCDPGDIAATVAALKADNIRVSIVGLAAEMRICKHICKETGGVYSVAMNEAHLKDILAAHVKPPPVEAGKSTGLALIEMGFPSSASFDVPTICATHGKQTQLGYTCPRCKTTVCHLPTDCPICSLTLVSSVLLARSYHHLFPCPPYVEVPASKSLGAEACRACQTPFPALPDSIDTDSGSDNLSKSAGAPKRVSTINTGRYECTECLEHFCLECDLFAHEVLHNCAGCLSKLS